MASVVVLKQLRVSNVVLRRFAGADVFGRRMYHEAASFITEERYPRSFKREDAQNFYLFVDMPGISKTNVEVAVNKWRDLVIKGKVVKDYECESRNYKDEFELAKNIEMSRIKANMKEDGVLKVILPKTKEIKQAKEDEDEDEYKEIKEFRIMVN